MVEVTKEVNLQEWYERKKIPTSEYLRKILDIFPLNPYPDIGLLTIDEFFDTLKDFFKDLYEAYNKDKQIEKLAYNTLQNFINLCKNYDKELEKEMEMSEETI